MSNLSSLLEGSAQAHPDRTAVVLGDTRLTYAQVDAGASQVANLLVSRGIEPGDKVALSCPNLPYFPIVYYGILKAGATVVPLNVLLKGREVAYHLDDSDAKAYFCFQGTADLPIGAEGHAGFEQADGCEHFFVITADPAAESPIEGTETLGQALKGQSPVFESIDVDDDDTAVILYTSGTTGQPKGAELMHRNMISNALASDALFGADADNPDTLLCVLPLFHSFGQTVIMNAGFAFGGTVVLLPRFEAGPALALMDSEDVTFFAGVPTMYWGLLGALDDSGVDVKKLAGTLRVAAAGGSALPVEVHKEFERRFGVTILEGYGLSETSPVSSFSVWGEPRSRRLDRQADPGRRDEAHQPGAGRPRGPGRRRGRGRRDRIRGPNIMKGYYGRPDATAETIVDGWFHSGDIGAQGRRRLRTTSSTASKDMIIRGGFNVYPREVEEVLLRAPRRLARGRHRRAPREPRRGGQGGGRPQGRRHRDRGRAGRVGQGADGGATSTPASSSSSTRCRMTATGKILKRELS